MKRYYIIGFILLIAFLMFVAAASAEPDSDVVIGTIGFFGIVALLPLFLYLVIAETRHIEEDIEVEVADEKIHEELLITPGVREPQPIAVQRGKRPGLTKKEPKPESARGIDRGFIEGIRTKQKNKSKGEEKEPEPKTDLLDLPERVDKVPVRKVESDEPPDESSRSGLVDIPDRVEEKSEPKEEIDEQLVSGLRADKTQTEDEEVKESKAETPKGSSIKDKSDDSHEDENKNENEPEKEEGD